MFPPANRKATDPASVYDVKEVIGEGMLEQLMEVLPEDLKTDPVMKTDSKIAAAFKG